MAVRNTGIGAVSQGNPDYGTGDVPFTRSGIIEAFKTNPFLNALISGKGLARQFQQTPGSGLGTFQAGTTTPGFNTLRYGAVSPTIESRPDKDSPLVSGTGIVSFDEAIDDPLQSMRELASLGLLQQSPTKATTTDDKSTTGTSTKPSKDKSATSTIDRKADLGVEEGSGLDEPDTAFDDLPTITDTTETDTISQEDKQSDEKKRSLGYADLIQSAINEFNKITGKDSKIAPKGARSIEEYKKEFSEATGIDISGEPDNRAALIALGTALMQNRAGKEFNVGEILSDVGKAGEKALPVFEAARKEAKAGQIAGGKFAIEARDRDKQARQDFIIEQRNYLTKVKDDLKLKELQRIETIEDQTTAQQAALDLIEAENQAERKILKLEAQLEPIDDDKEFGSPHTDTILQGTNMTVSMLPEKGGEGFVYFNPNDANTVASGFKEMETKISILNEMEKTLRELQLASQGTVGGQAGQILIDRVKRFASTLNPFLAEDEKLTPEASFDILARSFINSSKRFLTQETGNGISNVDVQGIKDEAGAIVIGRPLSENIMSLNVLKKRFTQNRDILRGTLDEMLIEDNFASDKIYQRFRNNIYNVINPTELIVDKELITKDDDGTMVLNYDVTTSGT